MEDIHGFVHLFMRDEDQLMGWDLGSYLYTGSGRLTAILTKISCQIFICL